jgi:hypothetical protein
VRHAVRTLPYRLLSCRGTPVPPPVRLRREVEKLGHGAVRRLLVDQNANGQVQLREYRTAWLCTCTTFGPATN